MQNTELDACGAERSRPQDEQVRRESLPEKAVRVIRNEHGARHPLAGHHALLPTPGVRPMPPGLAMTARYNEYGVRIVALYDVQDLVQSAPDRENIFRGLNRAGTAPSPSSALRPARVGRIAGISCVAAGLRPTTRCTLA